MVTVDIQTGEVAVQIAESPVGNKLSFVSSWFRRIFGSSRPSHCPECGGRLESWWRTTTLTPNGRRAPGTGYLCRRCGAQFDWMVGERGYELKGPRKHGEPILGPDRQPDSTRPQPGWSTELRQFYADLATLRDRLTAAGYGKWAEELRRGERNGTTSSEVLVEIGELLGRLTSSGVADHAGCRNDVLRIHDLGVQIWRGAYRK